MPLPTINGYTLLPLLCDWDESPVWTLSWDTEVMPSVRGSELRGALRRFPRPKYELPFVSPTPALGYEVLTGITSGQLSGMCAVPFHGRCSMLAADAVAGAFSLTLEDGAWVWAAGDYLLVFGDDLETWALAEVVSVVGDTLNLTAALDAGVGALQAGHAVYPLVYGRATVEDDQTSLSGDVLTGKVTIIGQTYLIPEAPAPACTGIDVVAQFLGRPVFPFLADVSTDPTRQLAYDPRQTQVGFGLEVTEPLQRYVAGGMTMVVDLPDACSISALVRFFGLSTLGRLHGFWCGEAARAARIAGAADAQHVIIDAQRLAATWQDQPAQSLLFREYQGDAVVEQYGQIAVVAAGADPSQETIALTAALGQAVDAGWDAHWLRYMRLKGDELSITFESENVGNAEIDTVELPLEYQNVETGRRPAYGYHFSRFVAGVRKDWYFTSFDEQVYIGDIHTQTAYQPAAIGHGGVETNLKGDREEFEIDTWMFAGNPLSAWIPFPPQYDVAVELWEVDLSSPTPAVGTILFSGFVQSVEATGKALKATCTTRTDRLNAALPRFRVQGGCNYELYGPLCRVPRANWSVAVTVVSITSDGLLMTVTAPGLGAKAEAWFQWGDAQGKDADNLPVYRLITDSVQVAGQPNQQELRIDAPFVPAIAAGATLVLAAGCSLDFFGVNGCPKFANQINFGGHPYIAQNLFLKAIDNNDTGAK